MPLLWLSLAFIVGILVGKFSRVDWWVWVIPGVLFFFLYIVDRFIFQKRLLSSHGRVNLPVSPILILFALCLGASRFSMSVPTLKESDLAWYNNRGEYILVGTVAAPPDIRSDRILYEIEVTELTDPREPDFAMPPAR